MNRLIIIHYHEIALKGKNRDFFENTLVDNIKKSLGEGVYKEVKRMHGRVLVYLNKDFDESYARDKIKKVFGIANFSFGFLGSLDLGKLGDEVWAKIENKSPESFRVTAKRSDKRYPKNSQEISRDLGAILYHRFEEKVKVDLKNPDLHVFCEITEKGSFFYFEKERAYGGLPVGTAGKLMSLISSGFDSPVASWKMIRRGAKVVFIHFHSYPYTSKASYENVKDIVKKLTEYQFSSKIYFVPFSDIQKEISVKCTASLRVILYRRFMLRIAERLANKENIKALVTGDSLAQVASQTIDNISVIAESVNIPILRPLIGENKEDIIEWSEKIDTYNLSSQPYEDCCSLFMPTHPETHGKLDKIIETEEKLDIDEMIDSAIEEIEIIKF